LVVDVNNPPTAELEDRHPIAHAVLLEYEYVVGYRELTILSHPSNFFRVRPPYFGGAEYERNTTLDSESRYFYFTHLGPHFDMQQYVSFHGQQLALELLLESALPYKVQTYLELQPPLPKPEPLMESAAALMAGLLGHWLEHLHPYSDSLYDGESIWAHYLGKRFRTQYEQAREHIECDKLLPERLSHFCSETLLLKLLDYNSICAWYKLVRIRGSAQDYRVYAQMYPEAPYAPTWFLEVPCWEVPYAKFMPIYRHGLLHLPCYWRALVPWLQQRWRTFRERSYAQWEHSTVQVPLPVRTALDTQARLLYRYYHEQQYTPPQSQEVLKEAKTTSAVKSIANADRVEIPDIEDVWALLPPCAAALRDTGRFPRNWERKQLSTTLWYGGVSEPTIRNFFEAIHTALPNDETFEARFNVAAQLELARADPHIYKTWCSQIIEDTIRQIPNRMQCPFVAPAEAKHPGIVAEFKKRDRKQAGMHGLTRACNDLCNGEQRFGGAPAHLVENALKRRAAGEQLTTATRVPIPVVIDEYAGHEYMAEDDEIDEHGIVLTDAGLMENSSEDKEDENIYFLFASLGGPRLTRGGGTCLSCATGSANSCSWVGGVGSGCVCTNGSSFSSSAQRTRGFAAEGERSSFSAARTRTTSRVGAGAGGGCQADSHS
jgi:hypothetical protein